MKAEEIQMEMIFTITHEMEGTVEDCFALYKLYTETLHSDAYMSVNFINPIPEDKIEFERLCYKYKLWDESEPSEISLQTPKLTEEEFYEKYCQMCGSQRCEGIGTPWFDGCQHCDELEGYENENSNS